MWNSCLGFIGEMKDTYTILDRKIKGTDTPIDRYIIMSSLLFSNKNLY